eukprot:5103580-Amphidinium_carterae.1
MSADVVLVLATFPFGRQLGRACQQVTEIWYPWRLFWQSKRHTAQAKKATPSEKRPVEVWEFCKDLWPRPSGRLQCDRQ